MSDRHPSGVSYSIPVQNHFDILEDEADSFADADRLYIRPLILATYNRYDFIIFLDTGAPKNLMSDDTYRKYFKHIELQKTEDLGLCDIQGGGLKVIGKIMLDFEIAGIQVTEEIFVSEGIQLAGQILLGFPAIVRHQIKIDPTVDGVIIQGRRQAFYKPGLVQAYALNPAVTQAQPRVKLKSILKTRNERESRQDFSVDFSPVIGTENDRAICNVDMALLENNLSQNTVHAISSRRHIILKPNQSSILLCKVNKVANENNVITLPETQKIKGISIESSIHSVKKNTLTISIANNLDKEVNLHKGSVICDVENFKFPVVDVDEVPATVSDSIASMSQDIEELKTRRTALESQLNQVDFPEWKPRLVALLTKYSDIVALKGDTLGVTDKIKHHISVPQNTPPIYIPAYRVPQSQKQKIETEIEKMLDQNIIEESDTPWSFPLLCVPKKDGTIRVVVDFRRLNEVTISDPYPMPSMRDLISTIGNCKIFSMLDLLSGFHQVRLDEESSNMTGFSSGSAHYRYVRMPFGLKSSPITFVRLIDSVFRGLLGKIVIAYIDDLIILGDNEDEHFRNLEIVLQRLQDANLKLKLSKCSFLKKEVTYLGHRISAQGVQVTDDKISAICNFPRPTNVKTLKSFLGVSGFYRSFIKQYAQVALPLTDLLKRDIPFVWGDSQEKAFCDLKTALTTPPVLAFPDFEKEFFMCTDASDFGLGSCLMQYDASHKLRVIGYYSRKLNEAERKYCVTDKESLAVVNSLKHFRFIIFGHKITIYTDHSAVREIFNNPNLSGKRARWFLIARDYEISIKYIPGRTNHVADALSRNFGEEQVSSVCMKHTLGVDKIIEHQNVDKDLTEIKRYLRNPSSCQVKTFHIPIDELRLVDDLLVRDVVHTQRDMPNIAEIQIVIPTDLVPEVLKLVHNDRAHPGRDETVRQARTKYYWKSMLKDIDIYCKNCQDCASHRGQPKTPTPISLYPVPQTPFERVTIDLLTNLSTTPRGHKHILVCMDTLTRFVELIPVKTKTAEENAVAFHDNFVLRYSAPEVLISDNGLEFVNQLMKKLCSFYHVEHVNTMPYHPQGNGLAERTVRKLLDVMRHSVGNMDPNWDLRLPMFQNTLNSSIHQSIKMSPFQALYGLSPRLPFDRSNSKYLKEKDDDPISTRVRNAKRLHDTLQENLMESNIIMRERQHKIAKKVDFTEGDVVFLKKNALVGPNYKLETKYKGPYEVVEKLSMNKYSLRNCTDDSIVTAHAEKMKIFGSEREKQKKKHVTFDNMLSDNDEENDFDLEAETRRYSHRLAAKQRLDYKEAD